MFRIFIHVLRKMYIKHLDPSRCLMHLPDPRLLFQRPLVSASSSISLCKAAQFKHGFIHHELPLLFIFAFHFAPQGGSDATRWIHLKRATINYGIKTFGGEKERKRTHKPVTCPYTRSNVLPVFARHDSRPVRRRTCSETKFKHRTLLTLSL